VRGAWHASVVAALAAGVASSALACGYCIDDKVAAVYDYEVVQRAFARNHQVVFFAIEGQLQAGDAARRTLRILAESAAGVDKGSARVSVEPASLSVAFDPARTPFAGMARSLSRKLAAQGLSLAILRVMDRTDAAKLAGKR
jgi:hypothetical protein